MKEEREVSLMDEPTLVMKSDFLMPAVPKKKKVSYGEGSNEAKFLVPEGV